MKILVTGGAGYIGSIIVDELVKQRHCVTVLDNLEYGHKHAVNQYAKMVAGNILDEVIIDKLFSIGKFDTVIHLAGYTRVEESIVNPKKYIGNNVIGGFNTLNTMVNYGVRNIIFASSGTVYGKSKNIELPCKENDIAIPTSPYGETKLIMEDMLKWFGSAYGIRHVSFRFFIVVGATKRLGQDRRPESSLVPCCLKAIKENNPIVVYGNDYNTKDGTAIRDFVDVRDIAQACLNVVKRMENEDEIKHNVYNISSNSKYSVLDIIKYIEEVTGKDIEIVNEQRRDGDPEVLIADSELVRKELGWEPQYGIKDSIKSMYEWQIKHPRGYIN